jgi:chaperonin 10 Kd subunit
MSQFDFGINLESIIQKLNHLIKEIIMSVNFKPLVDRVLVEPAPAETKTASGLIIPDTAKEKPQEGVVVAVGNGKKDEPLTVKVGDKVLYGKYAGQELKLDGKDYLIIRESDLLGILG